MKSKCILGLFVALLKEVKEDESNLLGEHANGVSGEMFDGILDFLHAPVDEAMEEGSAEVLASPPDDLDILPCIFQCDSYHSSPRMFTTNSVEGKRKENNFSMLCDATEMTTKVDESHRDIAPLTSESEETTNKTEREVASAASSLSFAALPETEGSCPCPLQPSSCLSPKTKRSHRMAFLRCSFFLEALQAKRTKKQNKEMMKKLSEVLKTKSSSLEIDNQPYQRTYIDPSSILDMPQQLNSHESRQEVALAASPSSGQRVSINPSLIFDAVQQLNSHESKQEVALTPSASSGQRVAINLGLKFDVSHQFSFHESKQELALELAASHSSLLAPLHSNSPKTNSSLPKKDSGKACWHCGTTMTAQWRRGPAGNKTLCSACGIYYSKWGFLVPEHHPLASPSYVASSHSNQHKTVMWMRSKSSNEVALSSESNQQH